MDAVTPAGRSAARTGPRPGIRACAALLCVVLSFSSCQNAAPFVPTPQLVGLAILAGVDVVVVGRVIRLVAEAVFSDGSREPVTPLWNSASLDIATTTPVGDISGVSPGRTDIQASYLGQVATLALLVLPNVVGTWLGQAPVLSCVATVFFASINFCGPRGPGSLHPFRMDLLQDGRRVTGSAELETLPFAGPVVFDMDDDFVLTPASDILLQFTQQNGTFRVNLGRRPVMRMAPFTAPTPDVDGEPDANIIIHEVNTGTSTFTGESASESATVEYDEFTLSR